MKGSLQATIACAAGIVAAVCTAAFIVPWMRHRVMGTTGSGKHMRLNQTLQEQVSAGMADCNFCFCLACALVPNTHPPRL